MNSLFTLCRNFWFNLLVDIVGKHTVPRSCPMCSGSTKWLLFWLGHLCTYPFETLTVFCHLCYRLTYRYRRRTVFSCNILPQISQCSWLKWHSLSSKPTFSSLSTCLNSFDLATISDSGPGLRSSVGAATGHRSGRSRPLQTSARVSTATALQKHGGNSPDERT